MWPRGSCFPHPSAWAMNRPGSSSDQTDADLDQDRSGDEKHSCGSSRDESPAPSADSGYSSVPGDSEASDTERNASSEAKQRAPWRSRRRACPIAAVAGEPGFTGPRSSKWNNRPEVGNICFFFGNWGKRTQQIGGGLQGNIDAQIKQTMPSHWPD